MAKLSWWGVIKHGGVYGKPQRSLGIWSPQSPSLHTSTLLSLSFKIPLNSLIWHNAWVFLVLFYEICTKFSSLNLEYQVKVMKLWILSVKTKQNKLQVLKWTSFVLLCCVVFFSFLRQKLTVQSLLALSSLFSCLSLQGPSNTGVCQPHPA